MVSKSDKSSIKFWLALNIEITYVRNALHIFGRMNCVYLPRAWWIELFRN